MTTKTLLWRGLDEPRMEIVYAESLGHAHGTQIGITYELRWRLDGTLLDLEMADGRGARVELGDADFFDLQHSAFFNSLPAVSDGLLGGGPARDYTMRFVRVPALTAEPYRQRYTPLGGRVVHYSSAGFEADISYGEDGYVDLYQDYLERIG